MGSKQSHVTHPTDGECKLAVLAALALLTGIGVGIVCGVFRISLAYADHLRGLVVRWAHGEPILGFLLVVVACAVATWVAVWLVRNLSPHAAGSGIPHVEAVLNAQVQPAPYILIPV